MSFLDNVKQTLTGRPMNIKEPTFIRDVCDAQTQVEKLRELKKIVPLELAAKIDDDIKMLSYGISGENNVAYELKNSYMPILILRDLHLEYKGLTAQIDFVVIDTKFILVIECKKMLGDIEVTSNGDFIRLFKNTYGKVYKREGIYSPIVQNQRHLELIKHIICDGMESIKERNCMDILRSIVIFANSKTIVNMKYTKAEVKGSVIRCDQLIEHMKKLHTANENGHWLVESGMYKVVEVLMAHHKDIEVDYTQKYNIGTDIKNEPSSSLTQIPIEETEIYKDLKEYRLLKSREEGIKAYYIFTNAQLEQIISLRPNNTDMLMNINGFAKRQCEKYGDAIIQTVKRYMPV
jgi:hypothetical protein